MGIPLFQEQALAIAIDVAGMTPAEADQLRRSMGHIRKADRLRSSLGRLQMRLVQQGLPEQASKQIAEDLLSFAHYGFPEAHAWSFGLLSYATAWLKANHPASFYTALLNCQPMGFYPPGVLVNDARRHGLTILPPCIHKGRWLTQQLDERCLRLGLGLIRGLGPSLQRRLETTTALPAEVPGIVRALDLNRRECSLLARAGAFDAFVDGRRKAAWSALGATEHRPLDRESAVAFGLPEASTSESILLDYAATGISIHGHPVEVFRDPSDTMPIAQLNDQQAGERTSVLGMVIARQAPETAGGVVFLLLEDETGLLNVVVNPKVARQSSEAVRFGSFLRVSGRVQVDTGARDLYAERIVDVGRSIDGAHSRDFH